MVERLMNLPSRTPEQEEMYELLVVLIEKFELEFYQPVRIDLNFMYDHYRDRFMLQLVYSTAEYPHG
jgi:hypothetical protein